MTLLVALAGPSRSGKGSIAAAWAECCAEKGLTCLERQLSDNGKWHAARGFDPTISRVDSVKWFDEMKALDPWLEISTVKSIGVEDRRVDADVSLQKYLQNFLQTEREVWGDDYWTDKILPFMHGDDPYSERWEVDIVGNTPSAWLDGFFDKEAGVAPTDLAIISDLRQMNEASRVRDVGGYVFDVRKPPSADKYCTGADHVTEQRLTPDRVHYIMDNSGTVEDLRESARITFDAIVYPLIKARG